MSHPAHAARVMLDLKGVDYDLATVLPGMQRIHLRLAGFRGGTVPALKLDGRRVQGSRAIARALEARRADPPLFPADPQSRARADEAAVRRLLAALPGILDRVDALLAEGVLATEPPGAAALQVLCSVRALDAFADLHDQVASHPCAAAARAIFPGYPEPVPPFLPAQWLPGA